MAKDLTGYEQVIDTLLDENEQKIMYPKTITEAVVDTDRNQTLGTTLVEMMTKLNGDSLISRGARYWKFTADTNTSTIEVPTNIYKDSRDILNIYHDANILLIPNENYSITGNTITLGYELQTGETLHIFVTTPQIGAGGTDVNDILNSIAALEARVQALENAQP